MRAMVLMLATGCASEGLSRGEAHRTFDAVNLVANGIASAAQRSILGAEKDFTAEVSEDGFVVHGEVDGGANWTGVATLDGDVVDDGSYGYAFDISLDDIKTEDGLVLNGDVNVTFTLDDLDLDLKLGLLIDIRGEVAVSGKDEGDADLNYDLDIILNGLSLKTEADGDISGHKVNPWRASAVGWLL